MLLDLDARAREQQGRERRDRARALHGDRRRLVLRGDDPERVDRLELGLGLGSGLRVRLTLTLPLP